MSYRGEFIDRVRSFIAGATVTGARFLQYDSTEGQLILCGTQGIASVGVAMHDTASGAVGSFYPIEGGNVVRVEAGAAVNLHAAVMTTNVGKAITATTNNLILGYAEQAAGADGDLILVRLVPGAKASA